MEKIFNYTGFITLLLATICLPFSYSIASFFITILFASIIFNPFFYKNFSFPKFKSIKSSILILSVLFFIWYIIGYNLSTNMPVARTELQIKIPFLLFPLILLYKNEILKKNLKILLVGFVFGSLINSIYILTLALYKSLYFIDGQFYFFSWHFPNSYINGFNKLIISGMSEFTYSNLAHFFHPAYIAMYLTFSIAIIFYLLKTHTFTSKISRIGTKFLLFFFSILIVFLNSRAGILSLSFIIFLSVYLQIFHYKRYVSGVIYSFIFSLLVYFAIFHTRLSRNIPKETAKTKKVLVQRNSSEKKIRKTAKAYHESRLTIWRSALSVFEKNIMWGVGIGDIKDDIYKSKAVERLNHGRSKYDAHNQFLQTGVGVGIIGLGILILLLLIPFFYSVKYKRYLLFSHLSIILINILFESVFSRSYGVLFFSLFFYLFIAYAPDYEDKFLNLGLGLRDKENSAIASK